MGREAAIVTPHLGAQRVRSVQDSDGAEVRRLYVVWDEANGGLTVEEM